MSASIDERLQLHESRIDVRMQSEGDHASEGDDGPRLFPQVLRVHSGRVCGDGIVDVVSGGDGRKKDRRQDVLDFVSETADAPHARLQLLGLEGDEFESRQHFDDLLVPASVVQVEDCGQVEQEVHGGGQLRGGVVAVVAEAKANGAGQFEDAFSVAARTVGG